jgi:hypothetical protein
MQDVEGIPSELRYFRDVVGHEVDFVIVRRGKPWMAVEVKSEDQKLHQGLKYVLERMKIPYAFQVSLSGTKDYVAGEINGCRVRILPLTTLLLNLP